MQIKSGNYVKYNSVEYKAIRRDNKIEIISTKPEDRFQGFIKDDDIYYKLVDTSEIDEANKVQTMARYNGRDFLLLKRNDKLSLITSGEVNDQELLEWGFDQINKGEYMLINPNIDQLEQVWEERTPIWHDILNVKRK